MKFHRLFAVLLGLSFGIASAAAADTLPEQAASTLKRAVSFYHEKIAVRGGYVYRYSDDLAKREGEGEVGTETVWVQPPGTPAVGMAYLEAYELLGEDYLLKAARNAAECLIQGQLRTELFQAVEEESSQLDRGELARPQSPAEIGDRREGEGIGNVHDSRFCILARRRSSIKSRSTAVGRQTLTCGRAVWARRRTDRPIGRSSLGPFGP